MNIESADFWTRLWREHNKNKTPFGHYSCVNTWNLMAKDYGKNHSGSDKYLQAEEVVSVLEKNGFNFRGAKILDIGCGPGHYAQVFAQKGAEVVCIDAAEKMIERLENETDRSLMNKIYPIVSSWLDIDLEKNGFAGKFDLVFANMTPAVSGPDTFMKLAEASKGFCWFKGWAGRRENPLVEELHRVVTQKEPLPFKGNFIFAFNLVCASGWFADTVFSPVEWSRKKELQECVKYYTAFFEDSTVLSRGELENRIRGYLESIAKEGMVKSYMKGHTGRMIWSVKGKDSDNG